MPITTAPLLPPPPGHQPRPSPRMCLAEEADEQQSLIGINSRFLWLITRRELTFDSNDLQGHPVVEFYHRRLDLGNGLAVFLEAWNIKKKEQQVINNKYGHTSHTLNLLREYDGYWLIRLSFRKYPLLPKGQRRIGRYGPRWYDNIKTDLQELGWEVVYSVDLDRDRDKWRVDVKAVMNLRVPQSAGNSVTTSETCHLFKKNSVSSIQCLLVVSSLPSVYQWLGHLPI